MVVVPEVVMVELILVYCLSSTPDRCLEQHQPLGEMVSALACTVQAQQVGSQYVAEHPLWRLDHWRCEQDRPRESPT